MRVCRLVRVVRVLRMVRVLRFFRELRCMLYSIAGSLRSLFFCFIMISLINFVFALIFVQAAVGFMMDDNVDSSDKADLQAYWLGLPIAMDSLFQALTGGRDWAELGEPLRNTNIVYYVVFIFYVGFSHFAVLNVLTGIFVENAIKISTNDRDEVILESLEQERQYAAEIKNLFHRIDTNGSGTVSWEELEPQLEDPAVLAYLSSLELTIQDARLFFSILSQHSINREVDIDAFVDGCMRVKGPAMGLDLQGIVFQLGQNREKQRKEREVQTVFMQDCRDYFKKSDHHVH